MWRSRAILISNSLSGLLEMTRHRLPSCALVTAKEAPPNTQQVVKTPFINN